MSSYASSPAPRPGDVAGTLRLLAYLALSCALVVSDHQGGWLSQFRQQASVAMQPLWWLAGLPSRLGDSMRNDAATRTQLSADNRRLRNELLVLNAGQARLRVEAVENARLRALLGAVEQGSLDVQLAPILDVDQDPTRQRLLLDAGSRNGVRVGQSVIDAGGLLGQVITVTPLTSTVLLVTDLEHAVPVIIARNGVRLVAYGSGRADHLALRNVPLSADVEVGDTLVTSGLGGRFPPGFPVGTITELQPDDSRAFLVGDLTPAAQLDRGRDVLLLRDVVVPVTTADLEAAAAEREAAARAQAEADAAAAPVGGTEATTPDTGDTSPADAPPATQTPTPPSTPPAQAPQR
ncbi:rod shape-determining protein MreC [Luteimonas fraxinea]|uniref:Cell shape-determining protein MreC n=1 Tax=Luteimonas fraxinea TaxID=2901869 RepID=A0ABS8U7F5_9GAMM|nr:rod shape-determining protein MreC [Luteimonas fraxinea]MCD9095603.1 rod shape-determining protein MreC [Luteimonas fraxinea]MCD9124185.1 rod shape-determining protein MreC [Luteimonas fraxinea]UHH11201.1 rod shape-determining protein MreC [Luteimonas fraxinea]